MARFRLRFNQYKFNIKLNVEGMRGFKQEKLIEDFFLCCHNGTHEDIKVQVIGDCDPNDQEARRRLLKNFPSGLLEEFSIWTLCIHKV